MSFFARGEQQPEDNLDPGTTEHVKNVALVNEGFMFPLALTLPDSSGENRSDSLFSKAFFHSGDK